jgi:hypothetical protein
MNVNNVSEEIVMPFIKMSTTSSNMGVTTPRNFVSFISHNIVMTPLCVCVCERERESLATASLMCVVPASDKNNDKWIWSSSGTLTNRGK